MRTAHLLLLGILGAALISTALCTGPDPDFCCFGFYDRRIDKKLIKSYVMTDSRCKETAAVFTTVKGRRICVDPKRPWVQKIITRLDNSSF